MDIENRQRIGKGLDHLKTGLAPFVSQRFIETYQARGKAGRIVPDLERMVGLALDAKRPFRDMDVAALLKVMVQSWNEVFWDSLGRNERSLVVELQDVRVSWAHQNPCSNENAYRALDSMHRLLQAIAAAQAGEVAALKFEQLALLSQEKAGSRETPALAEQPATVAPPPEMEQPATVSPPAEPGQREPAADDDYWNGTEGARHRQEARERALQWWTPERRAAEAARQKARWAAMRQQDSNNNPDNADQSAHPY